MKIQSWPTAIVLVVAIIAIATTVLLGPMLGVRGETLRWLFAGEALPALLALAGMRGLGHERPAEGRPQRRTRPPTLPVLWALALMLGAAGCGATLDPVYAGIGQGALELSVEAEPVIRASRTAAMRAAAERVHDSGGTIEEARAAVEAEASLWQCAVDGHRIFGAATSAYVDALLLASSAGGLDLAIVLRFVSPLATAGRALASCVASRGLALAMPFLDLIPASWGLTEVSDAE